MTLYLTKVWDFGIPAGPLQFSSPGWRENARGKIKRDDLVVLVGTQAEPTAENDRGRLLGMLEPTIEPVRSLDFDVITRPEHFDEATEYKWPFGLLIRKAWTFIDPPLLNDISNRKFGQDSAKGLVELNAEEAEKVLKLRLQEIPILKPKIRAQVRVEGLDSALRMSAPIPTTTRRGIMHVRSAPALTYAMQIIGSSNSFNIGWAFDFKVRMRQFNRAAMPAIGGLRYKPVLTELWDTAREAFRMEQILLNHFRQRRHVANHEILHGVTFRDLEAKWLEFLRAKSS